MNSFGLLNNTIYMTSVEGNFVFKGDINNKDMFLLEKLPEEDVLGENLYGDIVFCEKYLILVPLNAKHIWKYDLEFKIWKAISLGNDADIKYKFFGAYVNGNKIIMLGHYYPGILLLNVETDEIVSIKQPFLKFVNKGDGLFNSNYVIKDGYLLAPIISTNVILKLDTQSEKCEFWSLGHKNNKYSGIIYDGKNLWFVPRRNGKYVVIDKNNTLTEYSLPNEFCDDNIYFAGGYAINNGIVFAGVNGKTMRISNVDRHINVQIIPQSYIGYKKISDDIAVFQMSNYQLCLERINENIETDMFHLNMEEVEKELKTVNVSQLDLVQEKRIFGLHEWISMIINSDKNV